MKNKYTVKAGKKTIEREYSYIPVRYIISILITVLEILGVIGAVVACCYFIPYFYIAAFITQIVCVIRIVASDNNPDYKVPWLLFVLILPIVGFMLYFLFYSRKLEKKFIRRLDELKKYQYSKERENLFSEIERDSSSARLDMSVIRNSPLPSRVSMFSFSKYTPTPAPFSFRMTFNASTVFLAKRDRDLVIIRSILPPTAS